MDKEKILLALKQIDHPAGLGDVVSLGKISSLVIKDDKIGFAINMDGDDKEQSEIISYNCKQAINSIYPQAKISIVLTKESAPKERSSNKPPINNVKKIIAISSCKGGVGKSTVTVNLAATLAKENYKIGLADLDIYGPSVPQMLGVKESPLIENNIMLPIEKYGIKSISFGNLIEAGKAAIWRGPMVTKALNQLLRNTNWQDIDILLLDLPPGTGDIHLSLLENYPINGVILVSTPQQVALIDLEKSIDMYHKLNIPVVGIIENMSYFEDSQGIKNYIFGEGGARKLAAKKGIEFIGEIPININLRQSADNGQPIICSDLADDKICENFKSIANSIFPK